MTRFVPPIIIPVLAALGAIGAPAHAADWTIDKARSHVGFSGTQTGTAFRGRFDRYDAAIHFDPVRPETSRIIVVIDLASARTGDPQRDAALPGADWFDVAHAPTARFEATTVRKTGADSYVALGRLTLRGRTRPVTLPFKLQVSGHTAHAVGRVQLPRLSFGVGRGQWATGQWVGLDVGVDVDLTASER